ncbi:MAG TPA: hypothetical protein VMT98_16155, partial [Verrucomicrobiae bacterium]|nr:hypothetical protein [Verrucomicrobiae bacterium]
MAEKLSIQIALQGGAEIERQLADIGKAGQQAFAQIEQSAAKVGGFKNLNPQAVTAQLEQLGVTGTEAFGQIQKAMQTAVRFENLVQGVAAAENALVALGKAAVPVGIAIGAAFAAAQAATIKFAAGVTAASASAIQLG